MNNELDHGMETRLRAALGHLETLAPDPPPLSSRLEVGSPRVWPSPLKVAMAFAVAFLLAVPALVWLGSANPPTRGSTAGPAPTEFVTSIPDGEILLATSADWQLFGFITPDGVPCLRGAPFTDTSYCASPELWAIPGVFNWQGTWGLSGQAWVYGFIRDDVTQLEFQFQREGFPDPADAGSLFTAGPQPDLGWAIYVLEFNVDTHGLFTVVTAYGDNGVVLGSYDLRDECDVVSSEALEADERFRELCAP